jgi:hypothetical protein
MRQSLIAPCMAALVTLATAGQAVAQPGSTKIRAVFKLSFDCDSPRKLRDYGVNAHLSGVLNADNTATADLAISGLFFADNVHFDARLGRSASPAPGGTSQLRVTGKDRLRLVWSLPNNDLIVDVAVSGKSCRADLAMRLKSGETRYSMYGGGKFYHCSAARVVRTSCAIR